MGERHGKTPPMTPTVFLLTYPDFSLSLVTHFFLDGDPELRSSEVDVVVEIKGVAKQPSMRLWCRIAWLFPNLLFDKRINHCDQVLDRSNSRKEGFILACHSRGYIPSWRGRHSSQSWRQLVTLSLQQKPESNECWHCVRFLTVS